MWNAGSRRGGIAGARVLELGRRRHASVPVGDLRARSLASRAQTGCKIDLCRMEKVERPAVALIPYFIIAWRILYASMPARISPDLPCIILPRKEEWQALYCNIERMPELATTPPALVQAVLWIDRIGGFLAREGDGLSGLCQGQFNLPQSLNPPTSP
jgi:hypothetical protein